MKAFVIIATVMFVFLFPAYLFKTFWALAFSWLPALYLGVYVDDKFNR